MRSRRRWLLFPLMAVLVLAAASPASARIAGKVAFVHDGKVLVKQTATPSVRAVQVSGSVPARWVAITQSGAKVVWSAQNTAVAVRVRPSTASRRTKLFTFPGSASSVTPAWFGASGLRIGFIASRYTNDGSAPRDRIGWMNGDGTGARLVFDAPPGSIDARKLSWTGNGMLFAMRPAGSSFRNLYAYQPGSDTLTRITNAEAAGHTSYSQAVWSRGGRTIAAVVDGRLVVMDADGTNQRVGPAGRAPAFSPDGTTLAYIRVTDGRVRAISLDFSFERALVSNTATDISW